MMPPPEPEHGLAHEHAVTDKLTVAAAQTAQRNRELAVDIAPVMTERLRKLLQDPTLPSGRVQPEEGEQFELSPATTSKLQLLIPSRFRDVGFATFHPETDSQRTALTMVRAWTLDAKEGKGPMLALVGAQGCGKSHLLYAAARLLVTAQVPVYVRPWYRLADALRYGGRSAFAPSVTLDNTAVRDQLWEQRIVLLDELRPTASTEFDYNELAKFACWAYDERIAVLLTANAALEQAMGTAAASRFTELTIAGRDRR